MHAVPSQAWRKALSPRQANHLCRRILCVRPLYVPGAGASFHANLQAISDMYLYSSHVLVSLLPRKLRTPKENISGSTRERGKEHILRVVRLIICATDELEAVWAPEATAVIILGGAAV